MNEANSRATNTFKQQRDELVRHLRRSVIRDEAVLAAIGAVPREAFVEPGMEPDAYQDHALPISCNQTISQPTVVAKMTSELAVTPDAHVLEIGTGSGYQAAVLSHLARSIVSVELHADLARRAEEVLKSIGVENVEIHVADGSTGWPDAAPYDRIIVTAAMPEIPAALIRQLRPVEGSRLIAPVGDQQAQQLLRVDFHKGKWRTRPVGHVRFVPLRGTAGWSTTEWGDPPPRGAL